MVIRDDPAEPHLNLQEFEQTVLKDLNQIREEDRHKLATCDKIDCYMIVVAFVLSGILIIMQMDTWLGLTGPVPISGVAIRRMFRIG